MQLGKKLASGFVRDDAREPEDEQVGPPPDGTDAPVPETPPPPARIPEPTAAD